MYSKIAVFSAILAVCHSAALLIDNGHHQAISSQSIVRHDEPSHYTQHAQLLQPIQHSGLDSGLLQGHSGLLQGHSGLLQGHSGLLQGYSGLPLIQHSTVLQHAAPVVHQVAPVQHVTKLVSVGHHEEESHAPANYEFSYSVEDPHTGDHKSQHEARHGDVVKGEYSLVQPDGIIRKVEYTADHHNGFNAIVHNSGHAIHAAPVQKIPVAIHAPILAHH